MTRNERLLRLARLRGDRVAIATLEGPRTPVFVGGWCKVHGILHVCAYSGRIEWTETELRAAWGDR